ncbi:unnamed protein product [Lampetra planeri]
MGCLKSKARADKSTDPEPVEILSIKKQYRAGEESGVQPYVMDFAERLAKDIVSRAVLQWAELEQRYSDIPYIEADCDS